jgi:hypothetical protein
MKKSSPAKKPKIRDVDTADSGVHRTEKPRTKNLGSEGEATRDLWKPNRVRESADDAGERRDRDADRT